MENIGQANVFHEFMNFPRFLAGPRRFSGKPQIHGKHWPGQCFPLFFFIESHGNIGQANVFHDFLDFLDFGLVPGEANMFNEFWAFIRPA